MGEFFQGEVRHCPVIVLVLLFVVDLLAEDPGTEFVEVEDLDPPGTQGHLLRREEPFDIVDEGDVEAEKEDPLHRRVVPEKEIGLVDEDEGLAAAGGPREDTVASIELPGDGLLVVVEHLYLPFVFRIVVVVFSLRQLDAYRGEDKPS